jgi:hypothetical protein
MSATHINIRIDREIKAQAQDVFSALGLNMTTAINIFKAGNPTTQYALRCFSPKNAQVRLYESENLDGG